MADWQPISTAPHDRPILICISHDDGEQFIEVAVYDSDAETNAHGEYGPFVWATQASVVGVWARDIVTHWMPLPAPPAEV